MSASTARLAPRAEANKIDWSPYLVGVAIGVLSWAAFAIAKDPLGITGPLARAGAPVAAVMFGPEAVENNAYWRGQPFAWDYGVLLLVGLMAGAFVSSLLSGTFRFEIVPRFWRARFGGSVTKRLFAAFVGGAALMFGARLAGGCTSGHGISGTLQLALSSWVFIVVVFASALIASRVVFGPGGRG